MFRDLRLRLGVLAVIGGGYLAGTQLVAHATDITPDRTCDLADGHSAALDNDCTSDCQYYTYVVKDGDGNTVGIIDASQKAVPFGDVTIAGCGKKVELNKHCCQANKDCANVYVYRNGMTTPGGPLAERCPSEWITDGRAYVLNTKQKYTCFVDAAQSCD